MRIDVPPAPLEDWLRDNYFTAELNVCSSGVEPYSLADVRRLTGLEVEAFDRLVLDDGYSYGEPALRAAIAARWGDGVAAKVMTTCGSNEALGLVLTALLRPDDEVVVVDPGYHSLVELAGASGCRTRTWRLRPEDGWQPSFDELDDLVTPATRAIIVNFPHNPTGASIGENGMKAVLGAADRVGAHVVWDAAFTDLVYDTPPLPKPATLYERTVTVGTMSKAYGMPGLRFGWCIAPPPLLAECVRIRDYTTLHVSPLVELVARAAVDNVEALLHPRLERARTNRDLLRRWAADRPDVSLVVPAGGVASFPRFERLASADRLAQRLLDEHGVLIVPGSCFGFPSHVRLGYGGPTDELVEALHRLSRALDADLG